LVNFLRKELGVAHLSNGYDEETEFNRWFLSHGNIDELLDGIQASILTMSYNAKKVYLRNISERFVAELNARMLEATFGFQVEGVTIIKVNDQFAHSEIVVPALILLEEDKFKNANIEFRQAHAEFRAGHYEDCIHDCANAFESVLKIIISAKGWPLSPGDTASKLISTAFANNLIPAYMQTEFAGLRTLLESGVPTVRNKNGGHGAGTSPREIPSYIAAFQLHQTAAAIILLIESAK
jgi:hypothetical protein